MAARAAPTSAPRAPASARRATSARNCSSRSSSKCSRASIELDTTSDSLRTAEARADAARAGFRIASRKRDEGAISQVEFIDARSALTAAELNLNLTRFQLLARQAELDYATAAGTLPAELGLSP
jgi:outer membrane protein TolC